jgi:hypothetical protein
VRLPAKIEGPYRIRVVTNSLLGSSGLQVYEHGSARSNNTTFASDPIDVTLNPRPDLRVGNLVVPTSVTAGTAAAVSFTVSNMGRSRPAASGATSSTSRSTAR